MKEKLPISKQDFCEILKTLKEEDEKCDKLRNVMNDLYGIPNGRYVDFYPTLKLQTEIIKLLSSLTKDESSWIEYFVYDCDYGENKKYANSVEAEDRKIPLNTFEDLYNLLQENYKSS